MMLETQNGLSDADFQAVRQIVHRHCGINLPPGKETLVRSRLLKRLAATGIPDVSDYIRLVLEDPGAPEFSHLIDALSTNLTEFFREAVHFNFLARTLLPQLIACKSRRPRIRAWSAGCSSGQEAYSMAMTLLDALDGHGHWDLKLLATDISRRMLRDAQNGIYSRDQIRSVPPLQRHKHVHLNRLEQRTVFQIAPAVRDVVAFRYLNLIGPWPFRGPFDFIFCRNVMIYFDQPTQERLVNRLWDCLAPGGVLFTGHSESLTGLTHKFQVVHPTIYVKP